MKKVVLITVSLMLSFQFLLAQCNYPGPQAPAGIHCADAPLLCEFGLDGYCGTVPNTAGQEYPFPGCGGSNINNAHYLKFVAGSNFLEIAITPDACQGDPNTTGLQAGLFSVCDNQGTLSEVESPVSVSCGANLSTFTLTALLDIGETYYLVLNGFSNSICDYEIQVLEGETIAPELSGIELIISGPQYVQNGLTYEFNTQNINSIGTYDWTLTGGEIISGEGTSAITVEVTDDFNFEICVAAANDCSQTETTCQLFDINPELEILDITVCEGECFEINESEFCVSGIYDLDIEIDEGGDTSYYRLILTVGPEIETYVSAHACFGECYEFNNSTFCVDGTYTAVFTSAEGCDSTVTVDLTILSEDEPMVSATSSGDLDCENPLATLSAFSAFPDITYFWTGPDVNENNENDQTIEVGLAGLYTVLVTTTSGCTATAEVTVSGDSGLPEITITGNDPLNCNNEENTIVVEGVINGLDFEWSGPGGFNEVGPEITVDVTGTYSVIVITPSGCRDTIDIEVEQNNDPLFVDPGPNRHIQCEFIITLDAPGAAGGSNIVYQWTTVDGNILFGANTLNPVVNTDGTYTLTATDISNGCTGSADMVVYPNLAIIEGNFLELTCNVTSLVLDGSESYNAPNVYIQWSTANGNIVSGENTLTPTVDAPGIYQLVITKPGCLSFATVTVLDNTQPPGINIVASNPNITCDGAVFLTGNTNAQNGDIVWFKDGGEFSTDPTITVTEPGTYTFQVTGENGCVSSESITIGLDIDPSDIEISGDLVLDCALNGVGTLEVTITGNAPFYNISWSSLNGGEILTNNSLDQVTILGAGTYCVEVTNPENGCILFECIDVIETSSIDLNPTVVNVSCPNSFDGSISLSVTGGTAPYSYEWSIGAVDVNQIANLGPDEYSVTVTDVDGCIATQTFNILVIGTEDVTADAGDDQFFDCVNNTIVLDGENSVFPAGTTFEWTTNDGIIDNGATTLTPTVSSPGTYTLTIFSPEGCTDADEVLVEEYSAEAGPALTIDCNNPAVQLQGSNAQSGATYLWTTNNGNIVSNENTLTPTVNAPGIYNLTVTNANGCTYSDNTSVDSDFEQPDASVEAAEVFLEDCINPVLLKGLSNTPGVTYSWSGPSGTSNDSEFLVEAEGLYTLTVTGANGCTSLATSTVIDIAVRPEINGTPPTQYINCFNGDPLQLIINTQSESGQIEVSWTTQDGNIVNQTGNTISVDQAGVYDAFIMDTVNGCSDQSSVAVEEREAEINVETTIASCGVPDATATVITEYIHTPEYLWSTGETTASISDLAPGVYSVTISSPNSTCDEVRTVEIIQDPSCFVIISGYVLDDATLSCDENGNVEAKEGVLVSITPEDMETITDENGYYEFLVPPGDYTISPHLISPYVVECPSATITVSVPPGSSGAEDNNFFVKALSGFDLYVTAGSGGANAGSNQFYQISFCNNWFTTIFGTVEFTHDPLLVFDPVAAGASSYDPDTYTAVWTFEDLSFFECEYLSFTLFVPGDIPDGTVVSSAVIVLPTQGDIAPGNNSTSWIKTVRNNTSSTSITDDLEVAVEEQNLTETFIGENLISGVKQYPNPFADATMLEFELQQKEEVLLNIFDQNGRLVKSYKGFEQGFNQLEILAKDLPGKGMFFYQIVGAQVLTTGKMIKN